MGSDSSDSELKPVPGRSHFDDARLFYADAVELEAGETELIDVTLETRTDGPGEFSYRIFGTDREYGQVTSSLPDGLEISLEPSSFMASPSNVYHSTITLNTNTDLAPGEYWLRLEADFENVFKSTGWIKISVE